MTAQNPKDASLAAQRFSDLPEYLAAHVPPPQGRSRWEEYIARRKADAAALEHVDPRDYLIRYG